MKVFARETFGLQVIDFIESAFCETAANGGFTESRENGGILVPPMQGDF